jgi:hypothetical protein
VAGQTTAPPIKQDDGRSRSEAADELLERRFLAGDLQLTQHRGDDDDRHRAIADGRVGDRHAVVGAYVAGGGPQHGQTLAPELHTRSRLSRRQPSP